jgi:hypothetical protein
MEIMRLFFNSVFNELVPEPLVQKIDQGFKKEFSCPKKR